MVAEFAIYPMGEIHLTQVVVDLVAILKKTGLTYQVGPMGTSIEGKASEVFGVLEKCFNQINQKYDRVIMNVSLDSKISEEKHRMESMVNQVLSRAGERSQHF